MPDTDSVRHDLVAALAAADPPRPLGVAYSGGADSTALLVASARCWPGQVTALHVHHGLQAAADDFEAHCRSACARLGVPLQVAHIDARHAAGDSPAQAARRGRYRALAELAARQALRCVALAQHADDQIETLLLALSRGAGLPGLAGMAPSFERHGALFQRPLLSWPGSALRDWLAGQGEIFVEDPTNADTGYTRNRIRHQVLPALRGAFPQALETFARSARHAAQAQDLLDQLAAEDLLRIGGEPALAALRALPRSRQANLLRHWLRQSHGVAPSAAQLEELLDQVAACATRGHAIAIRVAAGRVERQGDRLVYRSAGVAGPT